MKIYIAVIVTMMALAGIVYGELTDFLGSSISAVQLSQTAAEDSLLILNSSGLIPGDILTADKLQESVKKLYALGLFSNVVIKGEKSGSGVNLFIDVETYPRISQVRFEGNSKIKQKNLKKEINISEGRIVSPGTVKSNIEKLKKFYAGKGYLLADVQTGTAPDPKQPEKVILTFQITEGRKVKIKNITFTDNKVFKDEKLRSQMSTKQKSFWHSGSFDADKYSEDKQKVVDFYKKEGYIDAVVTADTTWYSPDMRWMYIKLNVIEGPKYYFGKVTWSGNSIVDNKKIGSVFKIREGQIYNQDKYDKTQSKLYETYQDEGYWYVQIEEHKTPRDSLLDMDFKITENNPVYVKMINIEGNTKTKEKVVRRELKIMPETIFKRSILTRSLRDAMMLNFFTNVTPDWEIREDGNIDLIVKIEEKPTGQFSVGAGYSATDKLVGTVGVGIPNFLGGGQTISFNVDYGSNRSTFDLEYYEPWLFDTPTSIDLNAYYQERDYSDWFTEGRRGGSVRVGRRLRWPDNYTRVYGSYRLEDLKYYNYSSTYLSENKDNPYSVDKVSWPQITSVLGLSFERDSRDLAQFATKGSVYSWSGDIAGTVLGGNWNYWKQIFQAQYYYTPYWKFTFSAKAKWGIMDGIRHGDNDVPYSERFTPGGTDPDGVIRGYSDSRVGPRTPSGGYLGGRGEVIYNLELTVPVSEQQFYALLFADAGNAYLTGDGLKRNLASNFYKSVGFGFRVVAPMIGIIGFDFGYAFNGEDKGKIRPHFQIGRGF